MPPVNPTAAHGLRLQRAKAHIDELCGRITEWAHSQPFAIATEYNTKTAVHVARIRIRVWPAPDLGLAASDAVHNMRAALDNLICDLVPRRFRSHASFPILPTGGREQLLRMPGIRRLPEEMIDVLDAIQPYNATDSDPETPYFLLRTLDKLWNFDKHRQLTLFTLASPFIEVSQHEWPTAELFEGRVEDRKIIARAVGPAEPKFEPGVSLAVAFDGGPADGLSSDYFLYDCHQVVREIFKQILPGFDPWAPDESPEPTFPVPSDLYHPLPE